MSAYLNVALIIISVALMLVILIQSKSSSFSGSFSTDAAVFRTRRGLEKTLFQLALYLAVAFIVFALLNVVLISRGV